jgi:hypothetical protein
MSIGKTLQALNQMVADGIVEQYAIAGAVAALNYIEPSVTEDLDILISFEIQPASSLVTIGPIVGYMASKGYTEWRKEGLMIEGWPVQFLPVADSLDRDALNSAVAVEDNFGGDVLVSTRVLSAEHVVAAAVRTARPKDFIRIAAFLDEEAVDLDALNSLLRRFDLYHEWSEFCRKTGLPDPLGGR